MKSQVLTLFLIVFYVAVATAQNEPMERTIVLIRHAKSSHADSTLKDIQRPLNDRGRHDAPFMAKKVGEQKTNIDLIISSPSQRTIETMQLFCDHFEYNFDRIEWDSTVYLSSPTNLERIIRNLPDSVVSVAIVGHNPSMTIMANKMQNDLQIENVPTTGIVSVTYNAKNWNSINIESGKLDYFIYPKKFQ